MLETFIIVGGLIILNKALEYWLENEEEYEKWWRYK